MLDEVVMWSRPLDAASDSNTYLPARSDRCSVRAVDLIS